MFRLFIILILLFLIKSQWIRGNYYLEVKNGESYQFKIHNNDVYTNILLYCSSENTMEINEEKVTRLYVIKPDQFNYEKIYEINLISKSYSYIFKVYFIPKDIQADYHMCSANCEYSTELFNDYDFSTMALIFIDSKSFEDRDNAMLNVRKKAGNEIAPYYIPMTDDLDLYKLIYDINYKITDTISGNIFFPKDQYFIIKVIGSTYAFTVQYFTGNSPGERDYCTYHLFSNKEYIKQIPSTDYSQYQINFIDGTTENCEVEIRKEISSNTSSYSVLDTISKKNIRSIVNVEKLAFVSKNCDSVVTIIPNYPYSYRSYYFNENVLNFQLELGTSTLFRVPYKETKIRAFECEIKRAYKFGTTTGCPSFCIGIISLNQRFIETPVRCETIFRHGGEKQFYFLNPYFLTSDKNIYNDEYYIIITNPCLALEKLSLYIFVSYFDENQISFLNEKTYYKIPFYDKSNIFKNYYQINGPTKRKKVFSYSTSNCEYRYSYNVLYDYNSLVFSGMTVFGTTGYYIFEKDIEKDFLYLYFKNNDDSALFKYEFFEKKDNYTTKFSHYPFNIEINNTLNGKAKIEFYPFVLEEDVEYELCIIKTEEYMRNLCHYIKIEAELKKEVDIGIFNIGQNSNNSLISKEIDLNLGNEPINGLRVSVYGKTVNSYNFEYFYEPSDFDYNPKFRNEKKNNLVLYLGIVFGLVVIIVIIIVIVICRKRKRDENIAQISSNSKLMEVYV